MTTVLPRSKSRSSPNGTSCASTPAFSKTSFITSRAKRTSAAAQTSLSGSRSQSATQTVSAAAFSAANATAATIAAAAAAFASDFTNLRLLRRARNSHMSGSCVSRVMSEIVFIPVSFDADAARSSAMPGEGRSSSAAKVPAARASPGRKPAAPRAAMSSAGPWYLSSGCLAHIFAMTFARPDETPGAKSRTSGIGVLSRSWRSMSVGVSPS